MVADDHSSDRTSLAGMVVSGLMVVICLAIIGTTIVLTVWRFQFIAEAIAGKNTNFNFSVALSVSLVLNLILGGSAIASELARRRARKRLREVEKTRAKRGGRGRKA